MNQQQQQPQQIAPRAPLPVNAPDQPPPPAPCEPPPNSSAPLPPVDEKKSSSQPPPPDSAKEVVNLLYSFRVLTFFNYFIVTNTVLFKLY